MGCKKDEARMKAKLGRFRCRECGAVAKKKDKVCEPKMIKKRPCPRIAD
jgi:hypothetical protein